MAHVIAWTIGVLFLVSGVVMFFSPKGFVAFFEFFNPGLKRDKNAAWRRSPSSLNFRLLGLMIFGAGLWIVISLVVKLGP